MELCTLDANLFWLGDKVNTCIYTSWMKLWMNRQYCEQVCNWALCINRVVYCFFGSPVTYNLICCVDESEGYNKHLWRFKNIKPMELQADNTLSLVYLLLKQKKKICSAKWTCGMLRCYILPLAHQLAELRCQEGWWWSLMRRILFWIPHISTVLLRGIREPFVRKYK